MKDFCATKGPDVGLNHYLVIVKTKNQSQEINMREGEKF